MRYHEHPSTSLSESVVSGVDDTPFDQVPEIRQAREDDREVTPTLSSWRLEQAINVLQEYQARSLLRDDPQDLPPEHALLADDPVGLRKHLGDRVVLAWESADQEIVIWYRCSHTRLDLIEDLLDVFVHRDTRNG
jgi:hypothetical protein